MNLLLLFLGVILVVVGISGLLIDINDGDIYGDMFWKPLYWDWAVIVIGIILALIGISPIY